MKDGHFPEELAGFVGAVKGLANRVAHDTNRSYPVEYLVPALDQVLLVLEWYFEHERPSDQGVITTVVSPVASPAPPKPEAAAPAPVPATSAAVEPDPGRKAPVQLAVQGKKFSMSCTVMLAGEEAEIFTMPDFAGALGASKTTFTLVVLFVPSRRAIAQKFGISRASVRQLLEDGNP